MNCYAYMRASTDEQDALRATEDLKEFAATNGLTIVAWYFENISGTQLQRPELDRLLRDAHQCSVILVEKIDRLSRLNRTDWETLKTRIREKKLRIVATDLPTTIAAVNAVSNGIAFDVQAIMLDAMNALLLDLAAAWSRDDYETRLKRQRQGIKAAQERGAYKGRRANEAVHKAIMKYHAKGFTTAEIVKLSGASRSTVQRALREQ